MAIDPNQTIDKMIHLSAEACGHRGRTVRLDQGKMPLATCTYSYNQCDQTKEQVAERIAALWNLSKGMTTAEIDHLNAKGMTLEKLIDLATGKILARASATTRPRKE